MIQSLIVTNPKGEELTLDLFRPELSGLYIKSIDGLGPPSASINTQDVATIDGALYVGSRLETRNLTIELGMMDRPSVELNRLKAYRYFPTKRPVSVVVVTDNNKVKIEGYVESNEPDIFSDEESTKISIVCPDPYFYDIEPDFCYCQRGSSCKIVRIFLKKPTINLQFTCTGYALTMHQTIFGMVEANRQ